MFRSRLLPLASLHRHRVYATVLAALLLSLLGSSAWGQAFNPERYYQQCLAFERGGDFETARQSCLNALAADPSHHSARLALARIELALGDLAAAQSGLLQVQDKFEGAEVQLLLAEAYIRAERYGEAGAALSEAGRRIGANGNREVSARHAYLRGELAQRRGDFAQALTHLQRAVELDSAMRSYRMSLASLLFEMGDAYGARSELETYLTATGATRDAGLSSLLGRSLWATGNLAAAAEELERAVSLRSSRAGEEQAQDLRALGLVYYGLGDVQAGGLALREAARRGNMFTTFFASNLAWLLLLLLLLAVHLIGESRVGVGFGTESESPRLWSVGQVYSVAAFAFLIAVPTAVLYGFLRYDNVLALLTPIQSSDTLAVLFIAFSLIASLGAWRAAQKSGWHPSSALISDGQRTGGGFLLGLVLLAGTLAYFRYLPASQWRGEYFLDLAHVTPAVAAALAVIPLSEIFFRSFAFPTFEGRYGSAFAVVLSASLYALVFASPTPLLLALGLILAVSYRRSRSGALTLAAQYALHLGLLLAVLLLPWARSLFV